MRNALYFFATFALGLHIGLAAAQTPPPASAPPPSTNGAPPAPKVNEYEEASQIRGAAGLADCVWIGRRSVSLLWRDDIDTATRHINMYERFGCSLPHLKSAFRCLIRQGQLDPKQPESLNAKVHACWINPDLPPTDISQ